MSRIWGMMDVGRRAMMNSQAGLQTVSHNIANKSTEGYSRQRVEQQTNEPVGSGRTRMGTGSRISQVTRTNNSYLEKQIEREGANLGLAEGRAESLARVEQVFNEQINKGLNQYIVEFFNSFRELASSPENLATRTLVKETAEHLTRDFQRVHQQLSEIQNESDYQITVHVAEVNELTKEIAQLNEKIQVVEINGAPANDERDRRDLLLKQLGEKVNIRYAEGDNGAVTVTAGSNAILVSGYSHRELFVAPTQGKPGKREGNMEIFYKPTERAQPVNVTQQLNGGKVGGLLQVRDQVINRIVGDLDQLAYSLATEVNRTHSEGFNQYNEQGQLFFEAPLQVQGAAQSLSLHQQVQKDVGRIAAGQAPDSPGDNRVANAISSLQYNKLMGDGASTLDGFYASMVGQIGIEARRANSAVSSQQDILGQLQNIRESISGVSLDEETTKMIEYQKSFDASARLIRAADEMMDTVLNLKRY